MALNDKCSAATAAAVAEADELDDDTEEEVDEAEQEEDEDEDDEEDDDESAPTILLAPDIADGSAEIFSLAASCDLEMLGAVIGFELTPFKGDA